MAGETTEQKYETALTCEVCGEPLRLIRISDDDDEWLAECRDHRCRTLHRGSF